MTSRDDVRRAAARDLRARGMTVPAIAEQLGVSKSSAWQWTRDLAKPPRSAWRRRADTGPNKLARARLAEIAECDDWARRRLAELDENALFVAGIALYAGEGSKRDGSVQFTNTNPQMMAFFCAWLRRFFEVEERRFRARLYLHEGLDLDAATAAWAGVTGIPPAQFGKPYRAVANTTIRRTKHLQGCLSVIYGCSRTHRMIMGLCRALLSSEINNPA